MFKLFDENEIYQLYNKFVIKPREYYDRLSPLPLNLNNKSWKWEGKDFPRVPCVLDFSEWIEKYGLKKVGSLLATCSSDPELEFISSESLELLPYDKNQGDFHNLDLNKKFDFILFNQTIEHLYNPFISMKNLYNHLNDGGFLFTSVPTINIPHMLPFHFNGMTPIGLVMLMMSVGFEVLELGYWGNYDYISKLFKDHNWPSYEELIDENGNISNESKNTVQCWILVKK